jgi:hypothetical protein
MSKNAVDSLGFQSTVTLQPLEQNNGGDPEWLTVGTSPHL